MREYGSSRESDSGASTDWDYCQLVESLVTPHATVWPELENSFTVTNVTRETTRRAIVGVHQDKIAEATVLQGTTTPTTFCK